MIDGWAHTHWGSNGFLLAETLVPVAGTCVFILIALATRRFFKRRGAAA
jgi:hypothetical protein